MNPEYTAVEYAETSVYTPCAKPNSENRIPGRAIAIPVWHVVSFGTLEVAMEATDAQRQPHGTPGDPVEHTSVNLVTKCYCPVFLSIIHAIAIACSY